MPNFYGNDLENVQYGGNSSYYGGAGNDILSGDGAVNETFYGGDGNDVLRGRFYDSFGGGGTDQSNYTLNFLDIFPADNYTFEGGVGSDIIYGADGNDVIYGGDGDDSGTVQAESGTYWTAGLFGGSGDDYVDGGRGNDTVNGGAGQDALYGGEGNDTVDGGDGQDFLDGGQGDDSMNGGNGDDVMFGGTGKDFMKGGGGSDFLAGGQGNDNMFGQDGADILRGGDGDDRLNGGAGKDQLTGGAGIDTFAFTSATDSTKGAGRDVIKDFSHNQHDQINLSLIDANIKKAGDQAFTYIGDAAFTHHRGELHEIQLANKTLVEGDTNGDGKADFQIEVTGHLHLVKADFIL